MRFSALCVALGVTLLLSALPARSENDFDRPLIYGVNPVADYGLFESDPEALESYRDLVWQRLEEIGSAAVRVLASWREIEAERGKYDWSDLDDEIRRATAIGATPIVLIVNTPGWASPTGKPTHAYPPKEEMADEFEAFCRALATRYLGQARHFEFWNEQNGWGWHTDQGFQRADEYIPWLRRAYYALKEANPDCLVAVGGMDDAEGHAWGYMQKLYRYRDEWYPGEDFFDAVGDHPYSPNVELLREKINKLRAVMEENGDGHKPFWFTEYGWSLRNHTEEEQAARLEEFLDVFASEEFSDVTVATYLCIADFELSHVGIGLTDSNLRPRPAFDVFQEHPHHARPFHLDVHLQPAGAGALAVNWRTRESAPVTATVLQGDTALAEQTGNNATDHTVRFGNLPPNTTAYLRLSSGDRQLTIPRVLIPGEGVLNGDFEQGFAGGTARGWTITGKSFCHSVGVPALKLTRSGQGAQVLYSKRYKNQPVEGLLQGWAVVEPGKPVRLSAWTVVHAGPEETSVARSVGANPSGNKDPMAGAVWSDIVEGQDHWEESVLEFTPETNLIPIYVEVLAAGPLSSADHYIYIDDVRVEPMAGDS